MLFSLCFLSIYFLFLSLLSPFLKGQFERQGKRIGNAENELILGKVYELKLCDLLLKAPLQLPQSWYRKTVLSWT